MDFRILGPLEVVAAGCVAPLNAAKPRALLAILLLRAGEPIPSDRLIEDLWAGRPPATAVKVLQTYVSQLRKALGDDVIVTRPGGYELRVEPDGTDLHRFERLVTEARESDPAAAAERLREALALWRGPPLAEFAYDSWAQGEIDRLGELRVSALQDRIDADLALGRADELVGELERLVAEHPLAERLRGQLMLALYRSGRQAEALDAYRSARATLVEQLGIEPGTALRRLERAILDQDPELDVAKVAPDARPVPRRRARSTSFVGRGREQREIRALLSGTDVRLLTLTGPAGTGKTRLAAEATTGLDAEFPGGVVLVELAPISDAELVATTIAGALGLVERRGRGPLEALVASLGRRRTLLVLDNFEQLLDAAPMLTELLAGAPGLTLLVTSRAPLDVPEERIYPVPALQLPDPSHALGVDRLRRTEAVRLFVTRARDVRPDFDLSELNAGAVASLCLRLDGLPLPLELAAARIKLLSPQDILERLGVRLEVLKAEPGAGLPGRHRTLRAAIEWSYDLLGAEEQALFTSLGAFVGGFTLDGAKAVAGDLALDVVAGVESLLNNSLLRTEPMAAGEPRFGMLETIREHALERLAERGDEESVRRRHAAFYLPVAEESESALMGPQQLRWLERLDAERDNLRAALNWAAESGETEAGLRSATGLWRFWQMRAGDVEGRAYLDRLLSDFSGSPSIRAVAQCRAAGLAYYQGDLDAVHRYLEASMPVHHELGDDWNLSCALQLLTFAALAEGDADEARALAEEALELARRARNPMSEAYAMANIGVVLGIDGELHDAQRVLEESVRTARELGNLRSVGSWTKGLAGITFLQGDYPRARELFEEGLAVLRSLDDAWGALGSLSGLALVALEEHDIDSARHRLNENLELLRKSGHQFRAASSLEIAARLAATEGLHHRAARLYGAASVFRGSRDIGLFECEVWPDPAPYIAGLRLALGEEAFAEAWAEGLAMSFDESIDYALGEDEL